MGLTSVPELILSLRERELTRFTIAAASTTIGRDPSCDVVIDNVGISRLHATIEVIGDSFVLRDCDSENGITLNGEACREGRVVHGDIVGINKFLLRFSNQALEAPHNLQPAKPQQNRPRDVQRTMHVDREAAQGLVQLAKQQIARQRAESAARGGESAPPPAAPELARAPEPLRWEEPEGASRQSLAMFVGAMVLGGALIAGLFSILH
jgi:predicted component of type VI protein secretion system